MNVLEDFDLSQILWYKIGGTAKYVLEVSNASDLKEAVSFIKKGNIKKFMPIGLGANLIFTDEYYDGAIIRVMASHEISIDRNEVTAFAGVLLDDVIQFMFDKNLVGLEWAGGLPSTIGAAVRGNVGAFGGELKDSLKSGEVIDLSTGQIKTLSNSDFHFGYRDSVLKHKRDLLLVSATFELKNATSDELKSAEKTYAENREYRQTHHPLEYPNCGSVFKNIKKKEEVEMVLDVLPDLANKINNAWHGKVSMGYLIHNLGFSGFKVGNAQVSEKHNNFIVNLGGATFTDVTTIIRAIQLACQNKFGFTPEVEVEIVT